MSGEHSLSVSRVMRTDRRTERFNGHSTGMRTLIALIRETASSSQKSMNFYRTTGTVGRAPQFTHRFRLTARYYLRVFRIITCADDSVMRRKKNRMQQTN